jgi:hypothetical protein
MQKYAVNIFRRKLTAAVMLLLLLFMPAPGIADETQQTEYRIKAAFLFNFSRFVVWPQAALQARNEFSLCTLGETLFEDQLDTLVGKTVHHRVIAVKRYRQPEDTLDCHLVFIGDQQNLTETLWTLRGQPILTVSNIKGFTEKGGIIQFKLIDNKIRFRINPDAAREAGLTVSSKLLSLAIDVTGGR